MRKRGRAEIHERGNRIFSVEKIFRAFLTMPEVWRLKTQDGQIILDGTYWECMDAIAREGGK